MKTARTTRRRREIASPPRPHPKIDLPRRRFTAEQFTALPTERPLSGPVSGFLWRTIDRGRWIVIEDHVLPGDPPMALGVKISPVIVLRADVA